MKLLTVSELQRVISLKNTEKLLGIDFYIVNDTTKEIVGRLEFKPIEKTRIVTESIYTFKKKGGE